MTVSSNKTKWHLQLMAPYCHSCVSLLHWSLANVFHREWVGVEKRPNPTGANSYPHCFPMLNSCFPMLNSWSQYQISHWPEARWAKCSRATAAQGVTPVCWHASMMCWNRKCMVQQHTNAWYGYLMRAEWVRAASLKTDLAWDTSAQTKLARSSLTAIASFSLPPEEQFVSHW